MLIPKFETCQQALSCTDIREYWWLFKHDWEQIRRHLLWMPLLQTLIYMVQAYCCLRSERPAHWPCLWVWSAISASERLSLDSGVRVPVFRAVKAVPRWLQARSQTAEYLTWNIHPHRYARRWSLHTTHSTNLRRRLNNILPNNSKLSGYNRALRMASRALPANTTHKLIKLRSWQDQVHAVQAFLIEVILWSQPDLWDCRLCSRMVRTVILWGWEAIWLVVFGDLFLALEFEVYWSWWKYM